MKYIKAMAWISFASFFGLLTYVVYEETQRPKKGRKYTEIITVIYADGRPPKTERMDRAHETEADCLMARSALDDLAAQMPNILRIDLKCAVSTPE